MEIGEGEKNNAHIEAWLSRLEADCDTSRMVQDEVLKYVVNFSQVTVPLNLDYRGISGWYFGDVFGDIYPNVQEIY